MTKTILSILLCIRDTLVYTKNIYYIYQFLYLKIIAMGRKGLSKTISNKIRKHLSEGLTSKEISIALGISAATVNNYRLRFKTQGEQFPNTRGRRPNIKNANVSEATSASKSKEEQIVKGAKYSEFTYIIDGTKIIFNSRPKTLLISKKRMLVEF